MTVAKIYAFIWLFVLAVTGVMYLTGALNEITLTIIGFLISTMIALGMVVLLPTLLDSHFAPKTYPVYQAKTRKGFAMARK
ncbi:MAG TPA: hypothetical protein VJ781_03170 [Pyrinomonadaceae bacterium]|nr:hypothetical protein [Pyrinomonadaceae bacterium]